MNLSREITLDGNVIKIELLFKRLTVSGTEFNSRYVQYGEQKRAGAELAITGITGDLYTIPLPEWKRIICSDSNVLKVQKNNPKNMYSDYERELEDRLESGFSSFVSQLQRGKELLDSFELSSDVWYKTCMYKIPRTDYAIYLIYARSDAIVYAVDNMPILVKKRDCDNELRPVVISAELDPDSGFYRYSGGYVSYHDPMLVPISGCDGSSEIELLDILSTFTI